MQQIGEAFAEVDHPVQMLFFGSEENCEYCVQTQQLLSEVSEISDKVGLSIYDLKKDAAVASPKVDKISSPSQASDACSQSANAAHSQRSITPSFQHKWWW